MKKTKHDIAIVAKATLGNAVLIANIGKATNLNQLQVYSSIRVGANGPTFALTPKEWVQLSVDPGGFLEWKTGIPSDVLRDFFVNDGRPSCMAITAKNRPCKCTVPGVQFTDPRDWHRYPGGYCFAHSGEAKA